MFLIFCIVCSCSSRGSSRGRVYDRRRSPPRYSRSPRYSSRSPPPRYPRSPSRGREYFSPKRRYSRYDFSSYSALSRISGSCSLAFVESACRSVSPHEKRYSRERSYSRSPAPREQSPAFEGVRNRSGSPVRERTPFGSRSRSQSPGRGRSPVRGRGRSPSRSRSRSPYPPADYSAGPARDRSPSQ